MKGNKGITLIALIVTIIVLIILAGVAIAMLRGDSGILNRASEARYDTILSSVDEQVKLAAVNTRVSISAEMVSTPGYIATASGDTRFGKLVADVKSELAVKATPSVQTGFVVKEYLDPSTSGSEGTGYIVITYSDNALRASLPMNASTKVVDPLTFNGITYTAVPSTGVSPNVAVIVYVIKVTNYGSSLSKPIITTIDNATTATTLSGKTAADSDAVITAALATLVDA